MARAAAASRHPRWWCRATPAPRSRRSRPPASPGGSRPTSPPTVTLAVPMLAAGRRRRRPRRRAHRRHPVSRDPSTASTTPGFGDVVDPASTASTTPSCPTASRPGREHAARPRPGRHRLAGRAPPGCPVVVKGVLRADDARDCVAAGAAAVWVSNHGGRQLDRAVATARALAGGGRRGRRRGRGVRRRRHPLGLRRPGRARPSARAPSSSAGSRCSPSRPTGRSGVDAGAPTAARGAPRRAPAGRLPPSRRRAADVVGPAPEPAADLSGHGCASRHTTPDLCCVHGLL